MGLITESTYDAYKQSAWKFCQPILIHLLFCQGVIDGDLCEQYNSLDSEKKSSIALDLERTPSEVHTWL